MPRNLKALKGPVSEGVSLHRVLIALADDAITQIQLDGHVAIVHGGAAVGRGADIMVTRSGAEFAAESVKLKNGKVLTGAELGEALDLFAEGLRAVDEAEARKQAADAAARARAAERASKLVLNRPRPPLARPEPQENNS